MKLNKSQLHALRVLRAKVRMSDAGFKLGDSYMPNKQDTEAIKEATRLYIESWVVPIIDALETNNTGYLKILLSERADSNMSNY